MIRQHILFRGQVQGVGFRYYAVNKARPMGLTGWVRNLYDGSVEMEVQGERFEIAELITFLQSRPFIYIDETVVREIPPEENETGFRERR